MAECSYANIMNGKKPEVYTVHNQSTHPSVNMYLEYMCRHLKTQVKRKEDFAEGSHEWLMHLVTIHGTVIFVKTSRNFHESHASLKDMYKSEVVPALGRQIRIDGEEEISHISIIVNGETLPIKHIPFTNPDEFVEVRIRMKQNQKWKVEPEDITYGIPGKETNVVGPFSFKGFHEKSNKEDHLRGHINRLVKALPGKTFRLAKSSQSVRPSDAETWIVCVLFWPIPSRRTSTSKIWTFSPWRGLCWAYARATPLRFLER